MGLSPPCRADPISLGMAAFTAGKGLFKLFKKGDEKMQLNRIGAQQGKDLKGIGETLHKANAIRWEMKAISRDIQRSQDQAKRFQEGLKKHGLAKMSLVFFEQQVGMPLDPGYYVPNTPLTREWKQKARIKLGGARAAWGDCPMFEKTSRAVMKRMAEGEALDHRQLDQAGRGG